MIRFTYPRSFLSLLLIGFSIVAAPLVFALFTNVMAFERLAALSEQAVHTGLIGHVHGGGVGRTAGCRDLINRLLIQHLGHAFAKRGIGPLGDEAANRSKRFGTAQNGFYVSGEPLLQGRDSIEDRFANILWQSLNERWVILS